MNVISNSSGVSRPGKGVVVSSSVQHQHWVSHKRRRFRFRRAAIVVVDVAVVACLMSFFFVVVDTLKNK